MRATENLQLCCFEDDRWGLRVAIVVTVLALSSGACGTNHAETGPAWECEFPSPNELVPGPCDDGNLIRWDGCDDGSPAETQVSPVDAATMHNARIVSLSNNMFVVVWAQASGESGKVFYEPRQVVAALVPTPTGLQTLIEVAKLTDLITSSVHAAARTDGGFVVVWTEKSPGTFGQPRQEDWVHRVKARAFDQCGGPIGDSTTIVENGSLLDFQSAVIELANGETLVCWRQLDVLPAGRPEDRLSGPVAKCRTLSVDLSSASPPWTLATEYVPDSGVHDFDVVAMDGGGLAVVQRGQGQLMIRVLTGTGAELWQMALPEEVAEPLHHSGYSIESIGDNLVVGWISPAVNSGGQPVAPSSAMALVVANDGTTHGNPFHIADLPFGCSQAYSQLSLAALTEDSFVATWGGLPCEGEVGTFVPHVAIADINGNVLVQGQRLDTSSGCVESLDPVAATSPSGVIAAVWGGCYSNTSAQEWYATSIFVRFLNSSGESLSL
jgi:hypothetical protein